MPVVAVLIGLMFVSTGHALEPTAALREAVAAFQQGLATTAPTDAKTHFRRAADQFVALRHAGFHNAELARNEGNAALLAGDIAGAVFAYRLGLEVAPGDRALAAGLAFARSQVVYPGPDDYGRPPIERRPLWLPWPAPAGWLFFAVATFGGTCAAWTRWYMTRQRCWLKAAIPCYVLAATFTAICAEADARGRDDAAHPVVVVAKDGLILRMGDGVSFPPRRETPLPAGVEARLLYDRGAWLQVELAGGEVGWLPREGVLFGTMTKGIED